MLGPDRHQRKDRNNGGLARLHRDDVYILDFVEQAFSSDADVPTPCTKASIRPPIGFVPTQAGEDLIASAEQVEDALFTAQRRIAGRDADLNGEVKVSLPYAIMRGGGPGFRLMRLLAPLPGHRSRYRADGQVLRSVAPGGRHIDPHGP